MANYEANAELALRLIRANGRSLPMHRQTAGEYDPVEGTTEDPEVTNWPAHGIVLPASLRRMSGLDNGMIDAGTLVLSKARYVLLAAKSCLFEPVPQDTIEFDGITWLVIACVPLKPADIPIIYKLGVMMS